MYTLYSIRARKEPCGTPAATFLSEESSPSTETLNFLLVKKEALSLMSLVENCNSDSLYSRPGWVLLVTCNCFTYIAEERTWTYIKHISRDRYPGSLLARR
jgi:hypothetical protein